MPSRRKLVASALPFLLFVALLALNGALKKIDKQVWLTLPEYWIYPLQTILSGTLLIYFWREYDFSRARRIGFALLIGFIAFIIWISPQTLFGFSPRASGFNPLVLFNQHSPLYWFELVLRFMRLIVVVPLIEEIFWRGFLLRFLIDENFERVPFGAFSWFSFSVVTIAFTFSHSLPDWPAALVAGAAYNAVAYRTKSLSSCVAAHAVTNLLLGLWIVHTEQWGFW